jgi:ParB family chromosome partitioning protein
MGSDSKKATGADGRADLLMFDPDKVIIVTDKAHPLYDERCELPVDKNMVRNVMVHGILEPILVRRNGEKDGAAQIEVIAGRQRVQWARAANKLLVAEGKQPIRVPATLKRGDATDLMGIMISENEIRQQDTPLVRASKVQRYLNMGRSEEDAGIMFGVSISTIRDRLALLDCDASVQKAVETGALAATIAARQLSKLPRGEQKAALDALVASGATKGTRGMAAAQAQRTGGDPPPVEKRVRAKPALKAWLKELRKIDKQEAEIARAVLAHVLGNDRALGAFEHLGKAWKAATGE